LVGEQEVQLPAPPRDRGKMVVAEQHGQLAFGQPLIQRNNAGKG
jgi:hypothetical protein